MGRDTEKVIEGVKLHISHLLKSKDLPKSKDHIWVELNLS